VRSFGVHLLGACQLIFPALADELELSRKAPCIRRRRSGTQNRAHARAQANAKIQRSMGVQRAARSGRRCC
jgi:hypothetical protein